MGGKVSDPIAVQVIAHVETLIGSIIRISNGYYFDIPADSVLDLKKDLETDGSGLLRVSVYSSSFENRQQGDEAAYSQVMTTMHCHIDGCIAVQADYEKEVGRAMADLEKAVMKDISQGGLCLNTWFLGGEKYGLQPNGFGNFTVNFDVVLRHAVNDPSSEYQTTYN